MGESSVILNRVFEVFELAGNRFRRTGFKSVEKGLWKRQADVIMNITGNIISGQVTGETAKQPSERFGKIMQDMTSLSINWTDTSVSKSKQLDTAIPTSKNAALSSREFVGMVAE